MRLSGSALVKVGRALIIPHEEMSALGLEINLDKSKTKAMVGLRGHAPALRFVLVRSVHWCRPDHL